MASQAKQRDTMLKRRVVFLISLVLVCETALKSSHTISTKSLAKPPHKELLMRTPGNPSYSVTRLLPFSIFYILFFLPCIIHGQIGKVDSVTFFSQTQLDSALKAKVSPDRIWRLLGRSKENAPYLLVKRKKAGDVEIHEQWDDIAIIRSGHGILKTGHQVSGPKESGSKPSREWLGGVIQNGKERKLSPGDFIVIPAMLGHQYMPALGDSLTYWTIKVKRPK